MTPTLPLVGVVLEVAEMTERNNEEAPATAPAHKANWFEEVLADAVASYDATPEHLRPIVVVNGPEEKPACCRGSSRESVIGAHTQEPTDRNPWPAPGGRCEGCYVSPYGPWCDNCDQWPCICTAEDGAP